MIFVRHALAVVDRALPPSEWVLAPGAELSLPFDLPVVCSAETKARQTAALFTDACTVDARLGEVERGWSDDFEADIARYFVGEALDGWEPASDARARFTVENIGTQTVSAILGKAEISSVPFFSVVDPAGGDSVFVSLEPRKPRTFE